MINFYDKYRVLIVALELVFCLFMTIFTFVKYKRNKHKYLYYVYGFILMSIGMSFYLIKDIMILTYNNIENNIFYYYKIPLIIGILGFILVTIGAHKERSRISP